jgi:3-phosphoshikimate 1-carboxyvinyltransferase
LILAALAGGRVDLVGLNPGRDVAATARSLRALGVTVSRRAERWTVSGDGVAAFREPRGRLDCGNSGTTMRLLAGVVAGCPFAATLSGDRSLSARPMGRIADPLRRMGAEIEGRAVADKVLPPLRVRGGGLRAIRWAQPVASAQVKSAILLAAWIARVPARVLEPHRSRDHTERMLKALGEDVRRVPGGVELRPGGTLRPPSGRVPGDPSQGAFFAAAAAALRGSDLTLEGVCLNPTRVGFFRALARMGARVDRVVTGSWCGEPVGTLRIRSGRMRGVRVGATTIPSLLDELPVLAVLAAGACRGETRVTGAGELRVKESDRLASMADALRRLGADVVERPDGWVIQGGELSGGAVDACGDHRVAMALRIAGLLSRGRVRLNGADAMRVSHPDFDRDLERLRKSAR